ncbi:beta-lactamase/transpeptidase-like protein [Cucurbitaria berberidis CBS 394.84]|uniref:Beta-lactamase/transpeptidase-like protein n=1 Tax=Cucurbitaria berberidis CBS 394.84 TaxID=1168544 RepID=A0A9P4GAE7_9PLEO|nr:beta-lactamase/transpeptidase-like protein [Cucurbitaria berberidis CBS 394.84]KAF1841965.1 beta-lactamase/transpeptidase-like protein [Cucurbitaria berberidis CBS 394.84]
MANFETKLKEATAGEKPGILGVIALAIDRDGKAILSQAAGKTDIDPVKSTSIDKDSVLGLASCTKLITAIAALRLVEQGKLNLDDPSIIEKHLPGLWQLDIITSLPGQPLTYENRTKPLTARHLLTHTSGSGYDFLDPRLLQWRKQRGEGPQHLTGIIPDALALPSLFQPGEGWTYGSGMDWVGVLVSLISGVTLGEYMRKEIFDIVGCNHQIGFRRQEIEKAGGTIVQVATRGPDGDLSEHTVPEQTSERGGGGLWSSAENFTKILADLIAPEPKLLSSEMLDVLFAAQLSSSPNALASLRRQVPLFAGMTGPLTSSVSDEAINHALGGLLITEDSEILGKIKGTMVWGGGFGSLWFVNREKGVAAFYGGSMFPPGLGLNSELMGEFVRAVWGKAGGV